MIQNMFSFPDGADASRLPENWRLFLKSAPGSVMPDSALEKVSADRKKNLVFPPERDVFRAFELTPPEKVRACLLGQDPYHDDGQAEGLAFSVRPGVKIPASLRNIFKEYCSDLGRVPPESGSLRPWAEHGVLLLNSVLTVRAHSAGSHAAVGWRDFTDSVIRALSLRSRHRIVFLLWGNYAREKLSLIDEGRHGVIVSAHPSPLSAHRGFFGSRPFSRASSLMEDWSWPEL